MTTTLHPALAAPFGATLRRLYLVRFAFALVWAALLLLTSPGEGPLLTVLLVVYPLADAAAVLWQLRSDRRTPGSRAAERINVVVSVAVAVALGWASTVSVAAALGVWGLWAAASGLAQLVTAVRRRSSGGQVPQILSGALSIVAGVAFLAQSFQDATSIAGAGGYAVLGGLFFLVSAIRLTVLLRRAS
ncbi:DUF308 domain-containing protein [Jiangella rhizosphaerae]|uniref:DUF308 domain-containing protein n=1 Tax=Jiangella rhizosphaerae TaxID=2293569 RepID=A0A418KM05_9ACTN|nr:DUF308 domain-containing protein [Jiangella rhizosphaerae]RIQ18961.1 hypothetical protein DY240_20030 [Jiangella rhizosphaerae]